MHLDCSRAPSALRKLPRLAPGRFQAYSLVTVSIRGTVVAPSPRFTSSCAPLFELTVPPMSAHLLGHFTYPHVSHAKWANVTLHTNNISRITCELLLGEYPLDRP